MRKIRLVLEGLFVVVGLMGVSASGAIERHSPQPKISTESVLFGQHFASPTLDLGIGQPGAMTTGAMVTGIFDEPRTTYARYTRSTRPPPSSHSAGDLWLMLLVALTLISHQMRRKHRFLRPRPFGL